MTTKNSKQENPNIYQIYYSNANIYCRQKYADNNKVLQTFEKILKGNLAKITDRFETSHGEEVCHHSGETRRQTALRDETQLELSQTNHVVSLLPVPGWNVK